MTASSALVHLAESHIGERYLNVLVPKDNPDWGGPWDCAEFASWLVYQTTGRLYGCTDNHAPPYLADAYSGAWVRDVEQGAIRSVELNQALDLPGVILIRRPPMPGAMGHIAVSDGQGGTIEAAGVGQGVRRKTVQGRTWHYYACIPELSYTSTGYREPVAAEPFLLVLSQPNMSGPLVQEVQQALRSKGYNPGAIDGEYGPHTAAAVVAFQTASRLDVDGIVGPKTARRLGVSWPAEPPA